jgi:hypothetical protein
MAAGTPLGAQEAPKVDPGMPVLQFVYEEVATLDADQPVGETPQGRRNIVPIMGGTFAGPRLKGRILPGGWDWQLANPGGCFTVQADYMIQTDDGVIINVHNTGTSCKTSDGKQGALLTSPRFEAPKGKYDWLNGGVFVGTLEGTQVGGKRAVRIRFYQAQGAPPTQR